MSISHQLTQDPVWKLLQKEGNCLFNNKKYQQAIERYSKAIEELEICRLVNCDPFLAKLFSNRAACYLQLVKDEKDVASSSKQEVLQRSLKDAEKSIDLDPSWEKGYFRKAKCLAGLERFEDGIYCITTILVLHEKKGSQYKEDQALLQLLMEYKYFASDHVKQKSKMWPDVKYKEHCFAIDPYGAGDFVSCQISTLSRHVLTQISLLVRPGVYKTAFNGIMVKSGQVVDIIGDVSCPEEEVMFQVVGKANDDITHAFSVVGTLNLSHVTVKVCTDHPEKHGVIVAQGGSATLTNCKFYSKASGNIAVVGKTSTVTLRDCEFKDCCGGIIVSTYAQANIDRCQFLQTARVAVEIRENGYVKMKDSHIIDSGRQGLVNHAFGKGFEATRCTFVNNTRHFGDLEEAVSCSYGKGKLTNCQFMSNKGKAIGANDNGHVEVDMCYISGSKVGIGLSQSGSAYVKDSKFTKNRYGIGVLFNLSGSVTLENNKITSVEKDIILTSTDEKPTIISGQHTTGIIEQTKEHMNMLTQGMARIRTQKKMNKFSKKNSAPLHPCAEQTPSSQRMCPACGLSEDTLQKIFQTCSGCKNVLYCGPECQKKDWPVHKKTCKMMQKHNKLAKKM